MKTFYKNHLGHQYLHNGFEFICYNTGRKSGKWFVHFISEGAPADDLVQEQRTKGNAKIIAEKLIDKLK